MKEALIKVYEQLTLLVQMYDDDLIYKMWKDVKKILMEEAV